MTTQSLVLILLAVTIVAVLLWVWFRSYTVKKVGKIVRQVYPVWAAQGPFESGEQSAAAMRYAFLAVRGPEKMERMAETIAKHTKAYDDDPARWEQLRQEMAQLAGSETTDFVTIAKGFAAIDSLNKDLL